MPYIPKIKVGNTTYNIKDENAKRMLSSFMSTNPFTVSATISSGTSHYDFDDVMLYGGVRYSLYVSEALTSSNSHLNFYVKQDNTLYVTLVQGYNDFTPSVDGTIRIYNGSPAYSGSLTIQIHPEYGFMHAEKTLITNASQLSTITGGTKSANDFPPNSIVAIGVSNDLGLTDGPGIYYGKERAGTFITYNHKGSRTNTVCAAQFFFNSNDAMLYRYKYSSWGKWHKLMRSNGIYSTREAWLADHPSDKLEDLDGNTITCIGSDAIQPLDAPVSNFSGTVISLAHSTASLYPGNFQIAISLREKIYVRRYVYDATNGNYWAPWWAVEEGEMVYHVGASQAYTSLTRLLMDLEGNNKKKVIYIHDGTYDIWQEYLDEVAAGNLEIPPDTVSTGDYIQYSVFVPNNTRIVGWGNATLKMEPTAENATIGESYMWSPLNILGNFEMENVIVKGHNCRYCLHNDGHSAVQNIHQHYKNCKFLYTYSDMKGSSRLGYNNAIGFGLPVNSTYIFDDCEMAMLGSGGKSAFYGHENNAGMNGVLILRNCIIRSETFSNAMTIRLQTLGTNAGKVKAFFENCYINGGFMLDLYNDVSRNNFETTFVNCNKVAVTRQRKNTSVAINDPYTIKWYNPLPTPTVQAPLVETDSYSG